MPIDATRLVRLFTAQQLPVMGHTLDLLEKLYENEDRLRATDIGEVILRDPLMCVRVFQYAQANRSESQKMDATTVSQVALMHGVGKFFDTFRKLPRLEQVLAAKPQSLAGVRQAVARSLFAGIAAREWAWMRHDIEADEIASAALVHNLIDIMLWMYLPGTIKELTERRMRFPAMRSAQLQKQVVGDDFEHIEEHLMEAWNIPEALRGLLHRGHIQINSRVKTVFIAIDMARHAANGWDDPALEDDYKQLADMLNIKVDDAFLSVSRIADISAEACRAYGLPQRWRPEPGQEEDLEAVLAQLEAAAKQSA